MQSTTCYRLFAECPVVSAGVIRSWNNRCPLSAHATTATTRNLGDGEVAKLLVIPRPAQAQAGAEVRFGSDVQKLLCAANTDFVIVNAVKMIDFHLGDPAIAFEFFADDGDMVFGECVQASCTHHETGGKETKIISNCLAITDSAPFLDCKKIILQYRREIVSVLPTSTNILWPKVW